MQDRLFAEIGQGSAPPIVFLHGFGATFRVWNDVRALLAGGLTTIAYDLPGHGGSLHFPQAGPPKIAARAIAADLALRGVEQAHLVGHSMGGAIATLIAIADPGRVSSLTLLAPGGFGEEINAPVLRGYALAKSADEVAECMTSMAASGFALSAAALEAQAACRSLPGQTDMLTTIAELITRDGRQGVIPRELVAKLAMPVTVVWGSVDPILPPHQADDLPPNVRVRRLAGAGHMLPEERPRDIANILQELLG